MSDLDMDLLRAFVRVAETNSFTRAGQMLGASQSGVSLKIKKLEDRLGSALLARSPRSVRLTSFGARFLKDARDLIDLHDRVAERAAGGQTGNRLLLGISDHAAGNKLPAVIRQLSRSLPNHRLQISVGSSEPLFKEFKAGFFDAVMVRSDDIDVPAQTAFLEDLVWIASKSFTWPSGQTFPFVGLTNSCALKRLAEDTLKEAGVSFENVYTGTSVDAVQAAVSAGLGIACLNRRNIPEGCDDVGEMFQLPELPKTRMALFTRHSEQTGESVGSAILKAFQDNC